MHMPHSILSMFVTLLSCTTNICIFHLDLEDMIEEYATSLIVVLRLNIQCRSHYHDMWVGRAVAKVVEKRCRNHCVQARLDILISEKEKLDYLCSHKTTQVIPFWMWHSSGYASVSGKRHNAEKSVGVGLLVLSCMSCLACTLSSVSMVLALLPLHPQFLGFLLHNNTRGLNYISLKCELTCSWHWWHVLELDLNYTCM